MRAVIVFGLFAAFIVTASSVSIAGPERWPYGPQWEECDFAAVQGGQCTDCSSLYVCTPVGGFKKSCSNPLKPHCSLGECSAVPSAECAPAPAQDTPAQDAPAQDSPAQDSPAQDSPAQDSQAQDSPAQGLPAEDIAAVKTQSLI